jgi:hypothetical protein
MGDGGLEHLHKTPRNTPILNGAAQNAAHVLQEGLTSTRNCVN